MRQIFGFRLAVGVIMLEVSLKISGLYTIVECPAELQRDIAKYTELKSVQISCTMQLLCSSGGLTNYEILSEGYQVHEYDPDAEPMCEAKLKINIVRNVTETENENPCLGLAHHEYPVLLPHSTNCSLFYKCDWGVPMLFECPEELHFNSILQVCDWPWRAGCDSSWLDCPRPFPRCPTNHPGSLLLPHPFLCDHFYQCDWGTPQLQACPAGLYFDPRLKVCDWSYNSNCRNC
ncbi:uncharacterized protein LOC109858583 [Pseudomyrmex gracilis]|uniref:uncharacterized protein LOC109858583 n=1 Tax=Pseudomyrmex gracilis TaxID=219809 RepID=UPI00099497B7|nr:uncharacterized protein LOC109858583 [Pseudomyrmex gracilis]